jgi:hypothetical protein
MTAALGVAISSLAGCGGDEGGAGPASSQGGAATAAPGAMTFVRKLGGAGSEWAAGLAAGADGSLAAASVIGGSVSAWDATGTPQALGIAKLDAAGATVWARQIPVAAGTGVRVAGVARSPLGNVFLALEVANGRLDVGGGPMGGTFLVKLAPDGRFVWQRALPTGFSVSGLAIDSVGGAAVGLFPIVGVAPPFELGPYLTKFRWDGARLFTVAVGDPASSAEPMPVAAGPGEETVVARGNVVRKLDAAGRELWAFRLDGTPQPVLQLGLTAKGTVVARGDFIGQVSAGGASVSNGGPGVVEYVLAVEADGRPRWLRLRWGHGPMAIDPEGRIAFVTAPFAMEDQGIPERAFGQCGWQLVKWDLTGAEVWRRPLATCTSTSFTEGFQVAGIGVAPDHGIWVQGDATIPFDLGTGSLVPRESDWFLMRAAP